jgi:hypothetical protein
LHLPLDIVQVENKFRLPEKEPFSRVDWRGTHLQDASHSQAGT